MPRPKRLHLETGLVAEFLPPTRPSNNVMVICDGLPSLPSKRRVIEFWSRKGYWVFHPRYYGTWESSGQFLHASPEQVVFDLLDALPGGWTSVWSEETFSLEPDQVVVMGASFGGTAALLASRDPRVTKIIALAPVVDWTQESDAEPHAYLYRVIREGYAGAYRFQEADWEKMISGKMFQPRAVQHQLDPSKILLIHARDDEIVPFPWGESFAKDLTCAFIARKKGGHASSSWTTHWLLSRRIRHFLRT